MGDLSAHFSQAEFRCRHCGRLVGPDPALIRLLESVRSKAGRPVRILSGYRCPTHNKAQGGARRSQHLLGRAADIPEGLVSVAEALEAGARGVGGWAGWAVHLDTRPGSVTTWRYRRR